jgi:hypothetical protein
MVKKSAAVEHDLLDSLFLSAFRNELADDLRAFDVAATGGPFFVSVDEAATRVWPLASSIT